MRRCRCGAGNPVAIHAGAAMADSMTAIRSVGVAETVAASTSAADTLRRNTELAPTADQSAKANSGPAAQACETRFEGGHHQSSHAAVVASGDVKAMHDLAANALSGFYHDAWAVLHMKAIALAMVRRRTADPRDRSTSLPRTQYLLFRLCREPRA
jgi:hypothetical protein